jgi:DNA primase
MSNWIDFNELREQLDFGEVLRHYGVELKLSGDQHHGFCPLPLHKGKKNSPSFSANLKRGVWQCFGCGEKGNLLDFAVLMERANPESGEDVRRVASQIQERLLGGKSSAGTRPKKTTDGEEEKVVINAPLDFELKGLDAKHPYLRARGLGEETIEQFELGYCARGLLARRIAIPLHDKAGRLVGYAGRVIDDEAISEDNPKYKFPGRRKRKGVIHEFRKSLLVYNADRVTLRVDELIVVEGFSSVWLLKQRAFGDVVAVMGASCSAEQGEIIISLVKPEGRVLILTDGDAAGKRCAQDIFVRVAPHCLVRWVRLEEGKQPTDIPFPELQVLLWGGRA